MESMYGVYYHELGAYSKPVCITDNEDVARAIAHMFLAHLILAQVGDVHGSDWNGWNIRLPDGSLRILYIDNADL